MSMFAALSCLRVCGVWCDGMQDAVHRLCLSFFHYPPLWRPVLVLQALEVLSVYDVAPKDASIGETQRSLIPCFRINTLQML